MSGNIRDYQLLPGITVNDAANIAAGVAQVPRFAAWLTGNGSDGLRIGDRIGEFVNRNLGTVDADWRENPRDFITQNMGAALVGVPSLGLARFAASAPRAVRVAEAITPVTLPLTPGNIAANAIGGTVVGGAMQSANTALRSQDPDVVIVPAAAPPPEDDVVRIPAVNAAPAQAADDDIVRIPAAPPRTLGDRVADWLPYAALAGGGALAVRQALRQGVQRVENTQALDGTVVAPGAPVDPTVPIEGVGTALERNVLNEGARVDQIIREAEAAGAVNQPQAEMLRAQVDVNTNSQSRDEQAAAVFNTGIYPTGHRIGRPLGQIADELSQLAPDQMARVQEFTVMMNELANRNRAAEQYLATGDTQYIARDTDPATGRHFMADVHVPNANGVRVMRMQEPARTGLWDVGYDDLRTRANALARDPDAMRFAAELQNRAENWRRVLVREGYITQDEANRFARSNPWYLPTLDEEGTGPQHFQRRDVRDREGAARGQDVIQSWQDYEQNAVHVLQHNRAKREVAKFLYEYQQRLPPDKKLVGNIVPDSTPVRSPESIAYRDGGNRMKLEVYASGLAPVMRNEPKHVINWFNGMRKGFQFFTTGPGAAVFGSVFAPISAAYNTFSTLASRPAHLSAGVLDRVVQDLTRGRTGVRADPTFIAQALYAPLADMASVFARELSRRMQGTPYQPMASYLARAYEQSVHAQMQRYGATNTGIAATADFGTQLGISVGQISPRYDATRGVSSGVPRNREELARYASQFGVTVMPHQAVTSWHLFREMIDIVSNAPQSALWRQNADRVVQQAQSAGLGARAGFEGLARRVRQAGADPSIAGSNRGVTGLLSTLPYGNVAVQSAGVYLKAFRENPWGTAAAISAMTVLPALAAAWSAMAHDEEEIRNGRPPTAVRDRLLGSVNQAAMGTRFYLPGLPPEAAFTLIHDPTIAPIAAAVNMLVNELFGLRNPQHFYSQENARSREILTRLVNDRNERVMWESVARAGLQFSPPPLLDVVMRWGGVDMRDALNLVDPRVGDLRRRTYPGYEQGATADDPVPNGVRHLVEGMFGSAGVAAVQHLRLWSTLSRANAPTDTQLAAAAGLMTQRGADRNAAAAPLFQGPRRREAFDSVANFVRDAENKLTEIAQGIGDVNQPGTIGSGANTRVPQYGPGRVRPPDDIIPVLQAAAQLNSQLAEQRRARSAALQEMQSARSVPEGRQPTAGQYTLLSDPRAMRDFENRMGDRIREINGRIATLIVDTENTLSQRTGRRIRITEIDPTQGLDQFAPLSP